MGTLGNKWLILCRSNNCVSNSSCLHMLNGFLSSQTRLDTVSLINHHKKFQLKPKKQKHMLYASCAIWNTIGNEFVNIFIVLQDWWICVG